MGLKEVKLQENKVVSRVNGRAIGINKYGLWDPRNVLRSKERNATAMFDVDRLTIMRLLVANMVRRGNLSRSQRLFYQMLINMKVKHYKQGESYIEGLDYIAESIRKVSPVFYLKDKKVGAVVYKLPMPLYPPKDCIRAIRWLLEKELMGIPSIAILEKEIKAIYSGESDLYARREELYRVARENRPFIKHLNI